MLDDTLKGQLASYLERLKRPLELTVAVDDSEASRELGELVQDISEASSLVSVVAAKDNAPRVPSFGIGAQGEQPRVVFAGLPMGHEFTSLVLALLHVGGHPPKEDAELLEQIKQLDGDYHF